MVICIEPCPAVGVADLTARLDASIDATPATEIWIQRR
jgi:hypothetical protein